MLRPLICLPAKEDQHAAHNDTTSDSTHLSDPCTGAPAHAGHRPKPRRPRVRTLHRSHRLATIDHRNVAVRSGLVVRQQPIGVSLEGCLHAAS